jgi:hypothetical protein
MWSNRGDSLVGSVVRMLPTVVGLPIMRLSLSLMRRMLVVLRTAGDGTDRGDTTDDGLVVLDGKAVGAGRPVVVTVKNGTAVVRAVVLEGAVVAPVGAPDGVGVGAVDDTGGGTKEPRTENTAATVTLRKDWLNAECDGLVVGGVVVLLNGPPLDVALADGDAAVVLLVDAKDGAVVVAGAPLSVDETSDVVL